MTFYAQGLDPDYTPKFWSGSLKSIQSSYEKLILPEQAQNENSSLAEKEGKSNTCKESKPEPMNEEQSHAQQTKIVDFDSSQLHSEGTTVFEDDSGTSCAGILPPGKAMLRRAVSIHSVNTGDSGMSAGDSNRESLKSCNSDHPDSSAGSLVESELGGGLEDTNTQSIVCQMSTTSYEATSSLELESCEDCYRKAMETGGEYYTTTEDVVTPQVLTLESECKHFQEGPHVQNPHAKETCLTKATLTSHEKLHPGEGKCKEMSPFSGPKEICNCVLQSMTSGESGSAAAAAADHDDIDLSPMNEDIENHIEVNADEKIHYVDASFFMPISL